MSQYLTEQEIILHMIVQVNLGIVYEMMQYLHQQNEKHNSPSP